MTASPRHSSGLKVAAVRTSQHSVVLFVAGCLLGLAGCSAGNSDTPSAPGSASAGATRSPSPTSDNEDAAVIAAYTNSWDAKAKAYSLASSKDTDVKEYTTFQALADIERNLAALRKAGQVTTGKPVTHPKVVEVTDAKVPKATVSDCVDTTNWTLIDKASKKPVPLPSQRLVKYVSTATLEKWGTQWMVTELTAQDQAC